MTSMATTCRARAACRNGHAYAEFGRYSDGRCKRCHSLAAARYYPKNKADYRRRDQTRRLSNPVEYQREKDARWEDRLFRLFGVTRAHYDAMFEKQGGVCVVCDRPPTRGYRLAVDHCHVTGRVRGLACNSCNRHRIGANTVETARRVLSYLESDFDGRNL